MRPATRPTGRRARWSGAVGVAVVAAVAWGCGGDDGGGSTAGPPPGRTTTAAPPSPVEVTPESFTNLADMTPVRGFFVDNLRGDLAATLEVARSEGGGVYPVGSLVQLVPGEAMVKQPEGFSPGTRDWEFFELDASDSGTVIRVQGGAEVVNRFGGSCADCHALAEPAFDFICERDHGCDPLPIDRATIELIQRLDPRPSG